jgi:hypothetical protein
MISQKPRKKKNASRRYSYVKKDRALAYFYKVEGVYR